MSLQKSVPIKQRKKKYFGQGRGVDRSIIISKYKSTFSEVSAMLLISFFWVEGRGIDQYENKTPFAVYIKQPSAMMLTKILIS
jgi:hypothetical protein